MNFYRLAAVRTFKVTCNIVDFIRTGKQLPNRHSENGTDFNECILAPRKSLPIEPITDRGLTDSHSFSKFDGV